MIMTFAQMHWWLWAVPILIAVLAWRYFWSRPVTYRYPLTSFLQSRASKASLLPSYITTSIRIALLLLLCLLLGKPQFGDHNSKINVQGIDIMLLLDVSLSMTAFDDPHNGRARIQIAKEEAAKFVRKRTDDEIGLVIFGRHVLSRCPLTLDKNIITSIIDDTVITQDGFHQGTHIAEAIMVGVQRLQHAKSTTKIMVLLTDGAPSEDDMPIAEAVKIAKKFGIKIYTIGIGSSEKPAYVSSAFGVAEVQFYLDKKLLEDIAKYTGGQAFFAEDPQDLEHIYATIDTLEKTVKEEDVYYQYYDWFMPLLWVVALLFALEIICSTFIWLVL
jgi:Ca-activated chloride channel family protein